MSIENYNRLQEVNSKQLKKATVSLAKRIQENQQQIQKSFQPSYEQITKSMQLVQDTWSKAIQDIELPKAISISFKDLLPTDFEERINKTKGKFGLFQTIMMRMGYPPPHDIEIEFIYKIVDFYEEHGMVETKKLYLSYLLEKYNEETINALLEEWQSYEWLTDRMPILTQAIRSHQLEMYYASISTIMPQFEGVVVDHKRKPFEHVCQNDIKKDVNDLLNSKSDFEFDKIMKKIHYSNILSKFTRGKTQNTERNRHAILHGATTTFGEKLNSILLIIQFNYIIQKIDEEKKIGVE